MNLPILNAFKIPNATYRQKDFYNVMYIYFLYAKNYNSNLYSFASLHQLDIEDYILASNSYIDVLVQQSPTPPANPWNIYIPRRKPPLPPDTTGWDADSIEIVDAITACNLACYNLAESWIDFIVLNQSPPVQISNSSSQEISADYANLLIRQYAGLPNAWKTVAYLGYLILLNNKTLFDLQVGYNPLYAIGSQLDVIGHYYGLTRNISFTDGVTQWTSLNDKQYKIYLFFFIATRNCNYSYTELSQVLYDVFQNQVVVSSDQDMSISYYIIAPTDSDMYVAVYALLSQKQLPAPTGVWAKYVILSDDPRPFFAVAWSGDDSTKSLEYGLSWSADYEEAIVLWSGDFKM